MLRHPDGLVGGTEFREAVRLEIEMWGFSVADFSNLVRVATEEERIPGHPARRHRDLRHGEEGKQGGQVKGF